MLILTIVLVFLVLLYLVRISNNQDLIKENSKDKITDTANIKNARKYFSNKKTFKILLALTIISLIIIIICDFTSIEAKVIDYFAYNYYKEEKLDRTLYFLPLYLIVIRQIILEVKIGDFLFKYYKVDEPVLEENLLKMLLYKKSPQLNPQPTKETPKENKEENKEEIKEEIKEESK